MNKIITILIIASLGISIFLLTGEAGETLNSRIRDEVSRDVESLKEHKDFDSVKGILTRSIYWPYLADYEAELIPLLNDYKQSEASCIILGLFSLPEALKKELILSENTPNFVKAKLGNKDAEAAIIARFKKEASIPSAVSKLGQELLYINTENSWKCFFEGLESRETMVTVDGGSVSKVYLLLQCYGEINLNEPLFSMEVMSKHFVKEKEEFLNKEHQDYIQAIRVFFKQKYKRDIDINPPFLYLDQDKVGEWIVPITKKQGIKP